MTEKERAAMELVKCTWETVLELIMSGNQLRDIKEIAEHNLHAIDYMLAGNRLDS